MKKIIIIDTSILCVWLQVPGKDTCGSGISTIDYAKVKEIIDTAIINGATLVLPLATIIETGNHITHAKGDKYLISNAFCEQIKASIDETSPWAAFSHQSNLWQGENFKKMLQKWQEGVNTNHSLGDASIVEVANFYTELPNTDVEIFTGDDGLKSYQQVKKESIIVPRRRK
jgi:hypothetical protein